MHSVLKLVTATAIIAFACSASAQTSTTKSLSASLGVAVFPAKGQTAEKQSQDEGECFNWSKTQTGFDPMNPSASAPQVTPPPE
jgi:predicted signal transduction protein with EAL and GGDEF domain